MDKLFPSGDHALDVAVQTFTPLDLVLVLMLLAVVVLWYYDRRAARQERREMWGNVTAVNEARVALAEKQVETSVKLVTGFAELAEEVKELRRMNELRSVTQR